MPPEPLHITVVGPVPPPPGGAGASIVSVMDAISQQPHVAARRLEWYQIWRCLFTRTDVIHFNLNRPAKRLAATIVGRIFLAKVIHTIHANEFDFNIMSNRLCLALSDGFIVLNRDIQKRFNTKTRARNVLLTPILATNTPTKDDRICEDVESIIQNNKKYKIAAIYAHTKDFRAGKETYGLLFVAKILPRLKEMGVFVIFLDPKSAYSTCELDPYRSGNFAHVKRGVNFPALLQRIDVYLRPTSTDGNSVAVLESLQRGVPVIASDSVPRPNGTVCFAYGNEDEFIAALSKGLQLRTGGQSMNLLSSPAEYLDFIDSLFGDRRKKGNKSNNES